MRKLQLSTGMTDNATTSPPDLPHGRPFDEMSAFDLAASGEFGGELSRLEFYGVVVLLTSLSAVGVIGNAVVLCVYWTRRNRAVATFFIAVLAAVDFSTCLVLAPFTVYMETVQYHISVDSLCKLYQFLITSNIPFSAFIMAAIAVDRYFCICRPFLRILTVPRAKIVVLVLGLCAAGLGLCVALAYGIVRRYPFDLLEQMAADSGFKAAQAAGLNETERKGTDSPPVGETFSGGMTNVDFNDSRAASHGGHFRRPSDRSAGDCFSELDKHCQQDDGGGGAKSSDVETSTYIEFDTGHCHPNDVLLSSEFLWYFKLGYNGLFLLCLIIISVLYALIYRSVLIRRRRRRQQKSFSLTMITTTAAKPQPVPVPVSHRQQQQQQQLEKSTANAAALPAAEEDQGDAEAVDDREEQVYAARKLIKVGSVARMTLRERYHMANLKTAAILFVVAVVFVVTFFPAFLMTLQMVPYNAFIFYMYFANNVANPLIYSFMNKNFRDDMRTLFCRRWNNPRRPGSRDPAEVPLETPPRRPYVRCPRCV